MTVVNPNILFKSGLMILEGQDKMKENIKRIFLLVLFIIFNNLIEAEQKYKIEILYKEKIKGLTFCFYDKKSIVGQERDDIFIKDIAGGKRTVFKIPNSITDITYNNNKLLFVEEKAGGFGLLSFLI